MALQAAARLEAGGPLHDQFPLRKVISPKLWKHWGLWLFGLLVGAGILYGGLCVSRQGNQLGPGFVRLFDLSSSPIIRCYSSFLLVLSGQLALLIGWARSRSLHDFAGRYRLWVWAAGAWFGFAFCVASGAHLAWTETAMWLWNADLQSWNINLQNREALCWLLPATVLGICLLWTLHRDMRICRSSVVMLWLAAGLCLAAGVLELEAVLWRNPLAQPALAMGGHLCLLTSMLLHARFVIHVSAEPPELRRFRLPFRLPRIGLPRIRIPRIRLRSSRKQSSTPSGKRDSASTSKKEKRRAKLQEKMLEAVPSPANSTGPSRMKPDKPRKLPPTTPPVELDEEILDEDRQQEMLKGLSKRERKKLRKQWRDQQRTAAT